MTPDIIYDQMIGAGVARKLIFSWLGNPGVGGLHAIRRVTEGDAAQARTRGVQPRRHGRPVHRRRHEPAVLPDALLFETDLPIANPLIRPDPFAVRRRRSTRSRRCGRMSRSSTPNAPTRRRHPGVGPAPVARRRSRSRPTGSSSWSRSSSTSRSSGPIPTGRSSRASSWTPSWSSPLVRIRRTSRATTTATTGSMSTGTPSAAMPRPWTRGWTSSSTASPTEPPTWSSWASEVRVRIAPSGIRPVGVGRLRRVPVTTGAAPPGTFTSSEMMIVAAARELAGQRVCFVGVGMPNIAVNLAARTVAPDLQLVYESGVFGARPARLPLSIGDPTIVTGASAVTSMLELFGYYLQRGLVDVGLPGCRPDRPERQHQHHRHRRLRPPADAAARLGWCLRDRHQRPQRVRDHAPVEAIVRGAHRFPDVARQPRRWRRDAARTRREQGWTGSGPSVVVTDLGIYHFGVDGQMRLDSVHPGVTMDALRGATGWQVAVADDLRTTPSPRPMSCGSSAWSSTPQATTPARTPATHPTHGTDPDHPPPTRPDHRMGVDGVVDRHHLDMASEHVATDLIAPAVPLWRVAHDESRTPPPGFRPRWPSIPQQRTQTQA